MPDVSRAPALPSGLWRVDPLQPAPLSNADRTNLLVEAIETAGGPGLGWLVVVMAVAVWITFKVADIPYPGFVVGGVLGLLTCALVLYFVYSTKVRNLERQRVEASEKEANELATHLRCTLDDADRLALQLEQRQRNAADLLVTASAEFDATAFAPFWDAVERCASELGAIRDGLQVLMNSAQFYSSALTNRRHTFPTLRRTFEVGPELQFVHRTFDDIVRNGQRNYQFAVIWEHRMTRKAVIKGFQTVGEAVERVASAVYAAADSLQDTLHEGFDGVVAGQERAAGALANHLDAVDRIEDHTSSMAAAAGDVQRVIKRYRLLG